MIDMKKEELKARIKKEACEIALKKTTAYGTDYTQAVEEAIEETCFRLGISEQERMRLFI